jgi:hypothetical protein
MAYLYRKPRSPFWYVVYFDANQKEVHRSTKLRADNPNDTAKAKALRAELEAKAHQRAPVVNSEGWDTKRNLPGTRNCSNLNPRHDFTQSLRNRCGHPRPAIAPGKTGFYLATSTATLAA